MNIEELVGTILFNKEFTHILLVKTHNYKWTFPEDHLKYDESHLECAERSLYKLTGIGLNPTAIIGKLSISQNLQIDEKEKIYLVDKAMKNITYEYPTSNDIIKKNNYYFISNARMELDAKIDTQYILAMKWTPINDVLIIFKNTPIEEFLEKYFI